MAALSTVYQSGTVMAPSGGVTVAAAAGESPGFADLAPWLTDDKLPVEFPSGVPNVETAGPVIMVHDETVYAGECVAVVIAETRHIAEDACGKVGLRLLDEMGRASCRERVFRAV